MNNKKEYHRLAKIRSEMPADREFLSLTDFVAFDNQIVLIMPDTKLIRYAKIKE